MLFLISTFFLWQWISAINDKKQFEANDTKYRALKVSSDMELVKILYQTDSFYTANADWMHKCVTQEQDHSAEKTKISQLTGEKKKNVKDLKKCSLNK